MALFETEIIFDSTERTYVRKITPIINEIIRETKVESGLIRLDSMHTTCGLMINEGAEPNLLLDFAQKMQILVPEDAESNWVKGALTYPYPVTDYLHYCGDNPLLKEGEIEDERNAARHLRRDLLAMRSVSMRIKENRAYLGRYEDILFVEFDGRDGIENHPKRERTIAVLVESFAPAKRLRDYRLGVNASRI